LIAISNLIDLEGRHLLPPQPAELPWLQILAAGENIAECIVSPLSRNVVREPVVVHHVGENCALPFAKVKRPLPAHDIAQGEEFRIRRDKSSRHATLLGCNPVLNREPLTPRTRQKITT